MNTNFCNQVHVASLRTVEMYRLTC